MSGDNQNNDNMNRTRRNSVTQATFSNLFQRTNSIATGTPVFPATALNMSTDPQRRRLSITTLGISGASPTNVSAIGSLRRGSLSTNSNTSDSIDENAVEDDDLPANSRTAPTTPFTRRMSFGAQAMGRIRTGSGGSPGSNDQTGFNWSEQLRNRAESSVTGQRPSFAFPSAGLSTSPPQAHDRAKSVSDMAQPPAQAPKPRQPENRPKPKPDHFQERILKGDFYMD